MRSLNVFILDEMIEQFSRLNPIPERGDKHPSVSEAMQSELLVTLLEELKALRTRCNIYEIKILHMEQELRKK